MFESPAHLHYDATKLEAVKNFYNWSISYRDSSTFPAAYGSLEQIKPHPPSGPELDALIEDFGRQNTQMAVKLPGPGSGLNGTGPPASAAWFVSNCQSKSGRQQFVEKLGSFLAVDVYGAGGCSRLTCSRQQQNVCMELLNSTYKVISASSHLFYTDLVQCSCSASSMFMSPSPAVHVPGELLV
jgi:hypothetical protein